MSSPNLATFPYDDGGFVPVRARKKRKNRTGSKPVPPEVALDRTRRELENDWLETCLRHLQGVLNLLLATSPEVLCLGLGSPSSSRDARAQLAFLLEMCEWIPLDRSKVSVYDPVFSEEDIHLLDSVHLRRLTENRNAAYPLPFPAIVFMPHCDLQLYENLIYENWSVERLPGLVLIANRLSEYVDSHPSHKLAADFPCVSRLAPLLASCPLPPCASHTTAFNNLAIQYVRAQDLPPTTTATGSGSSFWELSRRPPVAPGSAEIGS